MDDLNDYIRQLRNDFTKFTLDENTVADDPVKQFTVWFRQAVESKVHEPNAMVVSTCGNDMRPSGRIVLLRDFGSDGFSFFTNYTSRKAIQLRENPFASMTFYWPELERQVRIEGEISKVSDEKSDQYFASRPLGSKVGAHISPQSQPIDSRQTLETLHAELLDKLKDDQIERPAFWGGYNLKPDYFEFWQGRASRLHDRVAYSLSGKDWSKQRIAP